MKTTCPSCGAPLEFRYDDSFVRVCDHCKTCVLRTDRGLDTLGKVGDLAPIDSPLELFASGHAGTETFILVGMAQLRHGAGGIWQEWYAKGDGDRWGWLAEAQGRYYLTYEATAIAPPSYASLSPGAVVALGDRSYTVAELGTATYVSARGEIPYRLEPDEPFRFADLSDGQGHFATIDYGFGDETPHVYVGEQVTLDQLQLTGGERAPEASPRSSAAKLACPNCNGSLELRAPDSTLRVVCPFCDHLISVEFGNLSVLAKLARKPALAIPLGTKGTFGEGEMTVIGYVERSALIDGSWYAFDEYLLHAKAIGFRWLVCSDGHWSYVQPIAPGAVSPQGPTYDGVGFRLYQTSPLRVDSVYGELYWQVAIGDRTNSQDFIAPPAMLSVEETDKEQNWSLSTYLTQKQLRAAFGAAPLSLNATIGVAPNQPYGGHRAWLPLAVGFALLAGIGIYKSQTAAERVAHASTYQVPPGLPAPAAVPDPAAPAEEPAAGSAADSAADPGAEPAGNVNFSPAFHLDDGKNVEVTLTANGLDNNWLYAAVDLVNEQTGDVVSYDTNIEYYQGIEDGESWTEGSHSSVQFIAPLPAGDYLVRVEAQHGASDVQTLAIGVRQDVFRGYYFWIAFGAMGLPLLLVGYHAYRFRKRQWANSNMISHGDDDD